MLGNRSEGEREVSFQIRKLPVADGVGERRRDLPGTEQSEFMYSLLKTLHLITPDRKLYHYLNKEFYSLVNHLAKVRFLFLHCPTYPVRS